MPDSAADSECPQESIILAYLENGLTLRQRKQMEKHFAGCCDCRELLALTAEIIDEQTEIPEVMAPMASDAVREQTARVLSIIEKDDVKEAQRPREMESKASESRGFYLSYPALAMSVIVICAIAVVPAYWLLKSPSPDETVMQQLITKAGPDGKRIEPQVSGLPWAEYDLTRGDEDDKSVDGLFNRALKTLAFAEDKSAPAKSRIVLARVYLMRARPADAEHSLPSDADRALKILQELSDGGNGSREVLNDTGVALFLKNRYDEAIDKFNQALKTSPNYSEALFNRALANERAGHIDAARRDLEQLINTTADPRAKEEAGRKLKLLGNSPASTLPLSNPVQMNLEA